jgi:peptidoglycan/LPS O-acetylase OafA/YrhL
MNKIRKSYIDVLKTFAIIAVVLYHSGFLTFGYLGVDLFLVINGYLITKSLQNKLLITSILKTGGGYT